MYNYRRRFLTLKNFDSVTMGHILQDNPNICQFFLSDGKHFKGLKTKSTAIQTFVINFILNVGIKCNQLHLEPYEQILTANEQKLLTDVPEEPLPIPESLTSVGVSCVNSPFSLHNVLMHSITDVRYTGEEIGKIETCKTLQVK